MSSIKESSLGLNYGWSYGETGWNSGMDENIVLTGFHANKQVKGILSTPPTIDVNNGDAYIVGSSPTGTWVGKYAKVAIYDRGSWLFATPSTGVSVYNKANGCWYEYNNGWSLKSEAEESPYIKVKDFDFSTGYTITDSRQLLFYPTNQTYYQWSGVFPKVVPAGSTPATTGGVGAGAWVDRTQETLRSEINRIWRNFYCIADIDGNVSLGDKVAVENYYINGDSGELFFTVVSAGTGAHDGGKYIDLPISGLQLSQNIKKPYTPEAFGAKGDGSTDDTIAINNCSRLGGLVKFSDKNYLVTSFDDMISVYWEGDGYDLTTITTSGNEVFPVVNYGRVKGIRFVASIPDTSKLFGSTSATKLSAYIDRCKFEDYDYAFYYPTNSDSTRFFECYFRGGNYGVFGNYAHNHHITQCIFWQQKIYSIYLQRGSASSIRDCNFVSTFGATSKVYLYSQDCIFEGNYIEHYTGGGGAIINDGFLHIAVNNSTNFPTVRNNLFNINYGFNYCIYFGATNTTQSEIPCEIYENEFMSHVISPIGFSNKNQLSNIDIRNNKTSSGIANYPRLRKYSSYVTNINTSSGTNIVVPIDSGIVYDPFGLATGSNTVLSYATGKRFKISASGKYTATVANTGINIKVRDSNNSTLYQLATTSSAVGDIPIAASFIIDTSESNSSYRVDWATIGGFTPPSTMNLLVEVEELPY